MASKFKGVGSSWCDPCYADPCAPCPIMTFRYSSIPTSTKDPCYTCCKPWIPPREPCKARNPCPFSYCNGDHPYCQGLPKGDLNNIICPRATATPLPWNFKSHSRPFPDCSCNPPWRACTHTPAPWGPNPPDACIQIVSTNGDVPFSITY